MKRAATARARRVRGTLLAALLVAAQASAWLHAAVVSHVTCLEHGEPIHAGAFVSEGARAPARASENPVAAELSADAALRAGHEHCGSGALLRWRDVVLAAPVATAPLAAFAPSLPFAPARAFTVGAAIYRMAPKTSPPVAGA